jgi:hypothetical protein
MGHLDANERVIEAKLTELGRRRLAEGDGLNVTQFALADDEVDYELWRQNLPTEDAGAVIENLPTYEAFVDETQSMRYKLITLEEGLDSVPTVRLPQAVTQVDLDDNNPDITFSPNTELQTGPNNFEDTGLDEELGYTAILEDSTYVNLTATTSPPETEGTVPALYGQKQRVEASNVATAVGTEFELDRVAQNLSTQETADLTIVGNETGLSVETTITVIP